MPAIILAKSGKRYTEQEWIALPNEEKTRLLSTFGPGYTEEAYRRNFKPYKPKRR